MKWLYKNGETHIDGLHFKKLSSLYKANEAIRRAALINDEYKHCVMLCVLILPNITSKIKDC